jgi:hypothetical protein
MQVTGELKDMKDILFGLQIYLTLMRLDDRQLGGHNVTFPLHSDSVNRLPHSQKSLDDSTSVAELSTLLQVGDGQTQKAIK